MGRASHTLLTPCVRDLTDYSNIPNHKERVHKVLTMPEPKPKGTEDVIAFLQAKKPFSAAKEELPFTAVTREALIHVAILTHEENAALKAEMACLKANMPRIQSKESSSVTLAAGFTGETVVGAPSNTAGAASPSKAVGTPMTGASASTSELRASAPKYVPTVQNTASQKERVPPSEKREEEKLCKSMWGKVECPGRDCLRVHLRWCSKPTCFINEDKRKECRLWHGHSHAARQQEKARKKREADVRQATLEQRQFQMWKKERDQEKKQSTGNMQKGTKGVPQNTGNWKKGTRGVPQQSHINKEKSKPTRSWEQKGKTKSVWPRPEPLNLGDFMNSPPLPSQQTAWEKPMVSSMNVQPAAQSRATGIEPRHQIQQILQNLGMLLQSGVFSQ